MIKWKTEANSSEDFYFTQNPKLIGKGLTYTICLTKDEKYLLVGSQWELSICETATRKVIKQFEMKDWVKTITLVKDGKVAIVSDDEGGLHSIDLETLEISSISENISNGNKLSTITVI